MTDKNTNRVPGFVCADAGSPGKWEISTNQTAASVTNKILGTAENWDSRILGADERYVSLFATNSAEVDSALGLVTVKLRMAKSDAEKLEELAKAEGLILQAYIKSILSKEINKN